MIIANVLVRTSTAETISCENIPKGSIGFEVHFEFENPVWETLSKTVVFRNSRQSLNSILSDNCAVIPHELLDLVGDKLFVGVYGMDSEQALAIPTVWATLGNIASAATPAEDTAAEATLPYWAQIQEKVDTLEQEMMTQEDLEAALLQAKESGEFDGPQGPQGEQGEQGLPGADGYTPIVGVDYWTEEDQELITAGAASMAADRIAYSSDIVCDSGGSVIALADAAERELKQLRIFGKTTQDGTPTPDAPVALESVGDRGSIGVSVCGKNLLDASNTSAQLYLNDGTLSSNAYFALFDFIPVRAGDVLTLSAEYVGADAEYLRWAVFDSEQAFISRSNGTVKGEAATITITQNGYIRVFVSIGNYNVDTVQLEWGATATEYEAYIGGTVTALTPNILPGIPVSSGGNYTDADGQQWICDEVDFANGVYVQRCGVAEFDGSSDEGWFESTTASGAKRFLVPLPSVKSGDASKVESFLNSHFSTLTGDYLYANDAEGCSLNLTNMAVFSSQIQTLDALSALLAESPMTVVFELATPIETALTADELAQYAALHTNKPNTTVYNDAGAYMEAEYVADTKTYIDNKFAELAAAIVANA